MLCRRVCLTGRETSQPSETSSRIASTVWNWVLHSDSRNCRICSSSTNVQQRLRPCPPTFSTCLGTAAKRVRKAVRGLRYATAVRPLLYPTRSWQRPTFRPQRPDESVIDGSDLERSATYKPSLMAHTVLKALIMQSNPQVPNTSVLGVLNPGYL